MPVTPLRILHAIHDFLPHAPAGSEIYASDLCRTLLDRGHHVTVVCAAFDPALPHGHVHWRVFNGLPVAEIANNWICERFEDTYRDRVMNARLDSILHAVQPDVVHIHNLLNLSFDLPRLAREHNARVVATLHDYTLVCPSGGQRIHAADQHVCLQIDPERCARCFAESPFGARAAWGRLAGRQRFAGALATAARTVRAVAPRMTARAASHLPGLPASAADIEQRLAAARAVFNQVDLFVSPSPSLASEYVALGLPSERVRVSDYGFPSRTAARAQRAHGGPLRIGFVGTPVWHKGLHVLIAAAMMLPAGSFDVVLYGDLRISPGYVAELRERAADLPVHFEGAFPRERVEQIYDGFDVLVVPSLWLENSPLVIHEAFLAGVPVVGSDIGGIPDLVRHDHNGLLFEAGNAGALAAALRSLIDDRALLARLASVITPVRSIEDDATDWERFYTALLESETAAAGAS